MKLLIYYTDSSLGCRHCSRSRQRGGRCCDTPSLRTSRPDRLQPKGENHHTILDPPFVSCPIHRRQIQRLTSHAVSWSSRPCLCGRWPPSSTTVFQSRRALKSAVPSSSIRSSSAAPSRLHLSFPAFDFSSKPRKSLTRGTSPNSISLPRDLMKCGAITASEASASKTALLPQSAKRASGRTIPAPGLSEARGNGSDVLSIDKSCQLKKNSKAFSSLSKPPQMTYRLDEIAAATRTTFK